MSILYISYDGMMEPLGQSQVIAYQERLAKEWGCHLMSFEKKTDLSKDELKREIFNRLNMAGINWVPIRYHKRPTLVATTWDIAIGVCRGIWIVHRKNLKIIHARSYVSALIALAIKAITGRYFIFDMRGFWVDERVDGGLWRRGGLMFKIGKWFERRFLLSADHVITLTDAAAREISSLACVSSRILPISVIPTCVDLAKFQPRYPKDSGFVLGYVGSVGTWYEFDYVIAFFRELLNRLPSARFLIINRNQHVYINDRLVLGGVPQSAVELRAATYDEIPALMGKMHAGIFFYKQTFSRLGTAPTKLAEFLGCGIPCIANEGVGDVTHLLSRERVGVVVRDYSHVTLKTGLDELLELCGDQEVVERCRSTAARHFSLEEGVRRYRAIYEKLSASGSSQ